MCVDSSFQDSVHNIQPILDRHGFDSGVLESRLGVVEGRFRLVGVNHDLMFPEVQDYSIAQMDVQNPSRAFR